MVKVRMFCQNDLNESNFGNFHQLSIMHSALCIIHVLFIMKNVNCFVPMMLTMEDKVEGNV